MFYGKVFLHAFAMVRVSSYSHTRTRAHIHTVTLLLRMDLTVHGTYQFFSLSPSFHTKSFLMVMVVEEVVVVMVLSHFECDVCNINNVQIVSDFHPCYKPAQWNKCSVPKWTWAKKKGEQRNPHLMHSALIVCGSSATTNIPYIANREINDSTRLEFILDTFLASVCLCVYLLFLTCPLFTLSLWTL